MDLREFEAKLSWIPLSLYLFEKHSQMITESIDKSTVYEFALEIGDARCYFCEVYSLEDKEYRRSVCCTLYKVVFMQK
jgi:hypothetical protein